MSDIKIEYPHQKTADEISELVDSLRDEVLIKLGLSGGWTNDQFEVEGKGVKGRLVNQNGQLLIELKLGLLVRPFKSKIESKIREKLAAYFP